MLYSALRGDVLYNGTDISSELHVMRIVFMRARVYPSNAQT